MQFTSTRNQNLTVSFSAAIRECIPADGGVFIPSSIEDMRRWIYYIDDKTPFASIAGSLTSALIKDEFSPIICETIATDAFPFEPKVRQLEDHLFFMELYHGYTGCHRDFGISYLCSFLETTLQLKGGNVVFLDFTHGDLGAILAKVLRGKKHIKSVLVYQKGTVHGIADEDLVWNGGNLYPVEMEGTEAEIHQKLSQVFQDKDFIQKNNVTVANTTNVCRLLGQLFTYPYSFAQIKNKIDGDVYYAMDAGNYGTLMAGLYSWRFALPVSGFVVPSTPSLTIDNAGNPIILDSMVELAKRGNANPSSPANLERLETFFGEYKMMLRSFVYPAEISEKEREKAAKELYIKYGIFADKQTARAYAAAKERSAEIMDGEGSIVLTALDHPSISSEYCRHVIGEVPEMPENIKESLKPVVLNRAVISTAEDLKKIIENL